MGMKPADINKLISMRDLAREAVLDAIGASSSDVEDGYKYQSMTGLSIVRSKKLHGAKFYFDGDALAMISVSDPGISPSSARSLLGDDVVELRSRQGKTANIELDAAGGYAFSADGDTVGFLEIFPPTTEQDYRDRIYWEPPAFTK